MMDEQFSTLDLSRDSQADYELAKRHAPLIRFDAHEPFFPSVAGYTVFRGEQQSPSFPRLLALPPGAAVGIEYAIWWDWDIQHLYELEHIWIYLDEQEQIVAADASWHGGFHAMLDEQGRPPVENGRVRVYSEPGKHAFAPVIEWLHKRKDITRAGCGRDAGKGGVLVTDLFNGIITSRTPVNNQLAWSYLERHIFEPSYEFTNLFDLGQVVHVPWANLFRWIPARVRWWAERLEKEIPPGERRVMRIAHRGASAYAQENSLAAIHKAAELGTDMVEVDLRWTADRVPVIAHDESLKRVFGLEGLIGEFTLAEINEMMPAGREPLVTLEMLAETCSALGMGIYLDIKQLSLDGIETMLAAIKKHGMLGGTIFGSFRPDWLAEIKACNAAAQTSVLFSSIHIDPVAQAKAVNCDYVHPCWERFAEPHLLLTPAWMSAVRDAELGVVCWHEERPNVIRALQALGVNGICSDQPELLLLMA